MLKPAGRVAMGYRSVHHGTQKRREVLATNEINPSNLNERQICIAVPSTSPIRLGIMHAVPTVGT
jgi:hypothetical protein